MATESLDISIVVDPKYGNRFEIVAPNGRTLNIYVDPNPWKKPHVNISWNGRTEVHPYPRMMNKEERKTVAGILKGEE